MKTTGRLIYRPPGPGVLTQHRVGACVDTPGPPCWHAACGWCTATSYTRSTAHPRSHADVMSWLAVHVRDEHGTAL